MILLSQKGYTLMEMMTVLAITASLSTLGFTAFSTQIAHQHLTDAGRQVVSDLRLVRQKAIAEGIAGQVRFEPSGRKYTLPGLGERALPAQIRFGLTPEISSLPDAARPDDGVSFGGNTLTFQPNGTIMGLGGAVYLINNSVRNEAVSVSVITTGRVKVRKWSGNEWK